MATATTNLGLRKPATTDLINVTTDISQSMDTIDALGDAWTTYTPSWGSTGTPPALGNGTLLGRYKKLGKTVDVNIVLTLGSTSTVGTGGWTLFLPVGVNGRAGTTQSFASGLVAKTAAGNFATTSQLVAANNFISVLCANSATSTQLNAVSSTLPVGAWAAGDNVTLQFRIEAS